MNWVETIEQEAAHFNRSAGVVVRCLTSGRETLYNADLVFPSASLIKLGVLYTLFSKNASGELSLDEIIPFSSEGAVEGGLLHRVRTGARLRLDDLALLMVTVSDNTAANMLIDRLRMESVNDDFKKLGLADTVLGRKMLDFEAKKRGRDNFTTAREMARLLQALHSEEGLPGEARDRMMAMLSAQKLNSKLAGLIPVEDGDDLEPILAHKTGELPGHEHDGGVFFYNGKNPVVAVVMTGGLQGRSEGVDFCARIGRIVFDAFKDKQ